MLPRTPGRLSTRVSRVVGFLLAAGPSHGPRARLNPSYYPYVSGLDRYWARAGFHMIKPVARAFIGSGRDT